MSADKADQGVILVVDDTPTNLEVLFDFLGNAGFRVLVAETGESAIEKAHYAHPDLILLDILMPEMDGFETCRRLKASQSTQSIPIIFLTALTDTENRVKGFHLGAVDFISKPLQCEEVLARVETHLRLQNLTKQLQAQNLQLEQQIQERHRAETRLKESEKKFRLLTENLQAAVWMADVGATENLYISPAYERIWGRSCESLRQQPRSWLEAVHPDDLERVAAKLEQQHWGHTSEIEYRIIRPDGTVRWVWDRDFAIHNDQGRVEYFGGTVEDITDRKLAEQKISEQAALIDVATNAIFVRDLEHRILFWNQGAERIYGWRSEEVLGKKVSELLYAELPPQFEEAMGIVLQDGEWQGELHQITKSERSIIVQSRWTLVRDETGQPKSILTVNTDITENKQLEAQFLRAQRLESIGTLASGIAHDLNNILTPILASAQLLSLKLEGADIRIQQLLNILEVNSKRGAELIKQVLSFARGVEGRRTPLQVGYLLREIEQIAKRTFPKSIEVYTDVPKSQLWLVSADTTQLHQVLMNLCVNAADAMPNGGILSITAENCVVDEVYARMHPEAHVGLYVVITISDTGMGIPPQILDRIFDPFFTTKEVGKGTGLGLSTAIGIVKSHKGFISVYSEVNQGTQFKVYLPTVERDVALPTGDLEIVPGQGELILVVDDELFIQETMKVVLEEHRYQVLTANNGFEAISIYAEHQQEIHVVMMDLMMPTMDGMTTIRTLQRMNPNVKIIATSGLLSDAKIAETTAIGVKAFLPKPFTAQELFAVLQKIVSDECSIK